MVSFHLLRKKLLKGLGTFTDSCRDWDVIDIDLVSIPPLIWLLLNSVHSALPLEVSVEAATIFPVIEIRVHIGLIFLADAAIIEMQASPVLSRSSTIIVILATIVASALGVLLVEALLLGLGWLLHRTRPHYLRFLFFCVVIAVITVPVTLRILILGAEVSCLRLSLRIILLVKGRSELSCFRCCRTALIIVLIL